MAPEGVARSVLIASHVGAIRLIEVCVSSSVEIGDMHAQLWSLYNDALSHSYAHAVVTFPPPSCTWASTRWRPFPYLGQVHTHIGEASSH